VPGHEFVFALELSDEPYFEGMLSDVTSAVLVHVGYHGAAIETLRAELGAALKAGAAAGHPRCDIRFRAHSGHLHVSIAYPGRAEWRATRALPPEGKSSPHGERGSRE
jgi:hypothetical protein